MLRVSTILTKLAVAAYAAVCVMHLAPVDAEVAPAFTVPSFDYEQLMSGDTPSQLLEALKTDGIVSIANIPSYAKTRADYLDVAARCAVQASSSYNSSNVLAPDFVISKTLQDGTQRYTISTPSGRDLDAGQVAQTTDAACPGYSASYTAFSSLLEWVVIGVSTALDSTSFTTRDGFAQAVTSRQLVSDAVRLDHFHAYYSASRALEEEATTAVAAAADSTVDDLSLELHEDDGMFIAFPTPAFYAVDEASGEIDLVSITGDDAATGLVIQTHDGTRVRPTLQPNAVTLMVGTGYNQWVDASEQLPAVMHGMRMPDVAGTSAEGAGRRLLRAWFGKMTLLPSHQRMLSGVSFEEHANATTRFVNDNMHSTDRALIGCSPGRKLRASADAECSYQACTVKAGATAPSEGCDVVCNRSHSGDAESCAASCSCTTSSHSATNCWMLCVLDLDTCDLSAQSCSGQAKVCSSTPTPTTTAPATTAPAPVSTTQAPATTTPATTTSTPSTTTPSTTTSTPSATTSTPSTTTSTPSATTSTPSATTVNPATSTPEPTYNHGAC